MELPHRVKYESKGGTGEWIRDPDNQKPNVTGRRPRRGMGIGIGRKCG